MRKNIFSQLFRRRDDEENDPFRPGDASAPAQAIPIDNSDPDRIEPESPERRRQFSLPPNAYTPAETPSTNQPPTLNVEQYFSQPAGRSAEAFAPDAALAAPEETEAPEAPALYADADPMEQARRRIDKYQGRLANPVNRDKGVKGAILEGIQNFLFGLGEARRQNPNAGVWEVLAGGGGAAVGGAINRTYNERRADESGLRQAQGDYQSQASIRQFQNGLLNDANSRQTKQIEARTKWQSELNAGQKAQFDRLDSARKDILKVYAEADEYDPKTPDGAALAAEAEKYGVVLLPKRKGERFQFLQTPDGRLVVGNTATGEYKVGQENFAKPTQISDNDIPDTLFPLLKSKELLDAEVEASVGKLPENRVIRKEVLAGLMREPDETSGKPRYQKEGGLFDEQKYWEDVNSGYAKLPPSQLYENLPDNYQQKVQQVRASALKGNAPVRAAVDKFKFIVSKQKSDPSAPAIPLTRIIEDFNKILALPAKERDGEKGKLNKFFTEVLAKIRVTQ